MTNETFYRVFVGIMGITLVSIGLYMSRGSDSQKPAAKPPGVMIEGVLKQPDDLLCHSKPYTDEELSYAAIDIINPMIEPLPTSKSQIPLVAARIDKAKIFVKTVQSDRIRYAYSNQVNYWESELNKAQAALESGESVDDSDQEDLRKLRRTLARARELAECLPKPGGKP